MSFLIFSPGRVVEIDFTSLADAAQPSSSQPTKFIFAFPSNRIVEIEYSSFVTEVTDTSIRITSDGNFRITEDGTLRSVTV